MVERDWTSERMDERDWTIERMDERDWKTMPAGEGDVGEELRNVQQVRTHRDARTSTSTPQLEAFVSMSHSHNTDQYPTTVQSVSAARHGVVGFTR